MDAQMPQIRVEAIKDEPDITKHASWDISRNELSKSSATSQLPSAHAQNNNNMGSSLFVPVGLALLVGFAIGAILFRKRNSHAGGYSRVPDVAEEDSHRA